MDALDPASRMLLISPKLNAFAVTRGLRDVTVVSGVTGEQLFTLDTAYAAFQESDLGSLTAGKFADFIVLDRDPLAVPAAEIPATVVLETWVGGHRAFQRH